MPDFFSANIEMTMFHFAVGDTKFNIVSRTLQNAFDQAFVQVMDNSLADPSENFRWVGQGENSFVLNKF